MLRVGEAARGDKFSSSSSRISNISHLQNRDKKLQNLLLKTEWKAELLIGIWSALIFLGRIWILTFGTNPNPDRVSKIDLSIAYLVYSSVVNTLKCILVYMSVKNKDPDRGLAKNPILWHIQYFKSTI
jgi:hypothetical protein